jgi:trans-4-hydroxy-L-proline dehydratase
MKNLQIYAGLELRREAFEQRRQSGEYSPKLVTCHFMDAYIENIGKPALLREALALRALWSTIPLPLYPDEEIAGTLCCLEPAGFIYGSATWIDANTAETYCSQQGFTGAQKEAFFEKLTQIDACRYHAAEPSLFTEEENLSIAADAATSTWFGGHMVLDFDGILQRGLGAYTADIEASRANGSSDEFCDAMATMLDAISAFILRYAEIAARMATEPGYDSVRFSSMAGDLRFIAHNKPSSFRQALQLVWIIHILDGGDSFGRFDSYMLPFLRTDTDSGMPLQEALWLLQSFWIKIEEFNSIQNMTIGGLNADSTPLYNELTTLCLIATRTVGYKGPNLCLRVTPDMPQHIWEEAMESISCGLGLPALYNDPVYIRSLVNFGFSEETARNYCLAGCSQIMIPGECNFINDIGMFNAAKVLELTLYNGFDPRTGRQVGLQTGDAAQFESFEQVLRAFEKQLVRMCRIEADINNKDTQYRRTREGYAMRTLFMKDCIASGLGVYHGGARYNNIELEIIGLTNVADSLYALKRAVFEEKQVCMAVLLEALQNDFTGYESLRAYLLNLPKVGNDEEEVDGLRARIASLTYQTFNSLPSVIGGVYIPGEAIFTAHYYCGQATGATPDGRKAGAVLADSAGPSQGRDIHGPTAVINSALRIPVEGHLLTSVVLNIGFLNSIFKQAAVRTRIRSLFECYFAGGGMQLQVNVFDRDTLQKAYKDPQAYRSLVVRVAGYSDYFVNLPPEIQKEIMNRTEHQA